MIACNAATVQAIRFCSPAERLAERCDAFRQRKLTEFLAFPKQVCGDRVDLP